MNNCPLLLPEGFETLQPFAADWSVSGSNARKQRRLNSGEADRIAFYDAASAHLDRAMAYLDQFPVDRLDTKQQNLLNLMLCLAHVALAVEKQGSGEAAHAASHGHFTITRATEDFPA